MALDALAIAKWSTKFLVLLEDAHVFKLGTNSNYEGEISSNGSVKIFTEPEVTTSSLVRGGTITYNRLTPGEQQMVIDQRQVWGIKQDKLEAKLAIGNMFERASRRAAWQLADDVDDYLRDLMIAATPSANILTSRVIGLGMGVGNAYELCVDLVKSLRKQNVGMDGLHLFINPDFEGYLTKDPRFTSFNTADARKTIRGTAIGMIEYADVHVSNNLYVSGATYTIQCVWDGATTYAEQLADIRHIPVTAGDKDERMDGELVFGGKVTMPQGLAYCNVEFAA